MTIWIYKATQTKIGCADTCTLATTHHFLCRSLYRKPGHTADRVRKVLLGDEIRFYYRLKDKRRTVQTIGAFEVVDGSQYPGQFDGFAGNTALVKVAKSANAQFLALLQKGPPDGDGYKPDPMLHVFTGWALRDLGRTPPDFEQAWMPGPFINLYPYSGPTT